MGRVWMVYLTHRHISNVLGNSRNALEKFAEIQKNPKYSLKNSALSCYSMLYLLFTIPIILYWLTLRTVKTAIIFISATKQKPKPIQEWAGGWIKWHDYFCVYEVEICTTLCYIVIHAGCTKLDKLWFIGYFE